MLTVYHAKPAQWDADPVACAAAWKAGQYIAVAEVATNDLEAAWAVTNSVHDYWWKNQGVTLLVEPRQRSTSMGDVIKDADGKLWLAAMFGFDELKVEEVL